MDTDKKYKLNCLDDSEQWKLLYMWIKQGQITQKEFVRVSKQIAFCGKVY